MIPLYPPAGGEQSPPVRVGRPTHPTVTKLCETCGVEMVRTKWKSGRWQDPKDFLERKYCSQECYREAQRGQSYELPEKYQAWQRAFRY